MPGTTNGVTINANSTGGATPTSNLLPNNSTAVVIKNSVGTLLHVSGGGIGSVPVYLKFYNNASACSGTVVYRYMIPAASTAANGAGSNMPLPSSGLALGTGITYCATTDITDTNSGAPAANTYFVNIGWN